ncbi:MAG TPA: hypothetical protein VMG41_03060 [Gemmatimonadales bacterium]|nr:hypothetical protein [Gemmatimonadales bacterium]
MKRLLSVVSALALASVLGTSQASAQSLSLGVGGGVTIPTGNFSDAAKTGWHALANLGVDLQGGFGIRADAFYGQNTFKAGSGKFKLAGGLGNITYSLSHTPGVTPYLIGSAGLFNVKTDVTGSASSTKFTIGGGAGLKLSSFFVEGRFLSIQTSGGSSSFIPITAGFHFGI